MTSTAASTSDIQSIVQDNTLPAIVKKKTLSSLWNPQHDLSSSTVFMVGWREKSSDSKKNDRKINC